MTRFLVMDQLVRDLKGFAAEGFPKDAINDYLTDTLIEPGSLDRYAHQCEEHKPYAACDVYDSERGPRRRVRLAYDSVHGQAVTPEA